MNCYAEIEALKSKLGMTGTTHDSEVLAILKAVSRDIETEARRVFYVTEGESRYFNGSSSGVLLIHDLLSVTECKTDTSGDESYADSWTEGTDYVLEPRNAFPKTMLRLHLNEDSMDLGGRDTTAYFKITGNWGAGDMESATPWQATSVTATVADATSTSLTLSATGTVNGGHTIRVESEQMFIESVSSTTATVVRGVNNTTAAAHSGKAVTLAKYPAPVINACLWLASSYWREFASAGYESERIGDYSYVMAKDDRTRTILSRLLTSVRRGCV